MEESLTVLSHRPMERVAAFPAVIDLYYEAKIWALTSLPILHWKQKMILGILKKN